jgi:hypothetical protein
MTLRKSTAGQFPFDGRAGPDPQQVLSSRQTLDAGSVLLLIRSGRARARPPAWTSRRWKALRSENELMRASWQLTIFSLLVRLCHDLGHQGSQAPGRPILHFVHPLGDLGRKTGTMSSMYGTTRSATALVLGLAFLPSPLAPVTWRSSLPKEECKSRSWSAVSSRSRAVRANYRETLKGHSPAALLNRGN